MSKLLFGALILVMVALLACNGEAPAQESAATLIPTSTPAPTPVPTATMSPAATPTPAPRPTATPMPTIAPSQQQVSGDESIAPLPLYNLQAVMSELSQAELACMAESGNSQRLSATLQDPDMASQEEIAELSLCLRDGTLLRLFLTGIIGQAGLVSGESAACIRAGFDGIDLRDEILAQVARENEGWVSNIFRMAISCLNEEEWAAAAPVLGLSLDYRAGVECFTRELGGPEEAAATLRLYDEEGPSFSLVSVALGCGISEADILALTTALTSTGVTPADEMSAIAPFSIEDPMSLLSELSLAEQSCISDNVDPQQLAAILNAPGSVPAEADSLIQCLEHEALLRVFITRLIGLTSPLSVESSACIRMGVKDIDLLSLISSDAEADEPMDVVVSMSAYMAALFCLNDEEWEAASTATGMDPGERESLQCAMNQLGGTNGLTAALQSEDGSGAITILTAALGCGLQIGTGAGG